jgi:hypothetical protein
MNKTPSQGSIIAFVTLLLTLLQPAYANGGHLHVEGIFLLLLLGIVIFLGGLFAVFYFLLRPDPAETQNEHHDD